MLSIIATSVSFVPLVLLGLSAALGIRLSMCLADAGTLQEILLLLLPQCGNHIHAFTACEVAPVMSNDDVVQECTIILDDIGTHRATGYEGFVSTFHLFHCKDRNAGQGIVGVEFQQQTKQHNIAAFKHHYNVRLHLILCLSQQVPKSMDGSWMVESRADMAVVGST